MNPSSIRRRLALLGHSLLYTSAMSVALFSPLFLLSNRDSGPPVIPAVIVLALIAGAGVLGTLLFGIHLDFFELPPPPHSPSSGISAHTVRRPVLKAGLLTLAAAVPHVYTVVQYTFFWSVLPRMELVEHLVWSAVMAVAASLALAAHRRLGAVLIVLVLVAGVGTAPNVGPAIESWERDRDTERKLEWLHGIDADLVVLDADGWEVAWVVGRPNSEGARVRGYEIRYHEKDVRTDRGYRDTVDVTTWNSLEDMGAGMSFRSQLLHGDPLLWGCIALDPEYECTERQNANGERVVLHWRTSALASGRGTAYVQLLSGEVVTIYAKNTSMAAYEMLVLVNALRWEEDGDRERLAREWFPGYS
ncbi:hypothetical protein [Nocardiopsis sp. NRRL B-16309]|uniref:hypothetical protein n=1 Tax=Nocardiopsis sp. NRRL B-16309 TaxID=1519494 RepID=UPI0006AEBDF1|nr:hypothetical protein [Nocardiopsis sp. NRRL B-16309]KOX15605.1 hypothetical protein ADL05_14415 [Nocardiopsis sp. NRRL B-16309]